MSGVAVVGVGYWGKNLARNFAQLGALHTLCDGHGPTLERIAAQHKPVRATRSYEEVLSDPAIEGVVLATPAALHFEHARAALAAGKDVFVEKPLALHEADGEVLLELARERGRILMVGHVLEYHPAVRLLTDLVERGELGSLRYVYSNRLNLGKVRTEENILW